ncbi:hypothetical protein BCR44DRAFT_61027 [Catenaria anguillulae PL171]|uniref:G-protein coupled receptors family 3 profile domain-containing protein n=1 Tax=Catenaria anguillulae PL171 TaxID=765915 RepID=A0A1Y2HMC7_9FUNG|nr:hypothetical protein BCR44DRAFT_61027 [Catenaria anguillulae PL171]
MFADCALALARGLVQLKRQYGYTAVANGLVEQGNLSAFIQPNVGFTGNLVFNSLGDRQGEYQVFNFWSGEYLPAFQVYPNQTILQLAEPKFWSGSSLIPPDRPMPRPQFADWTEPSAAAAAAMTTAILVAIAATSAYLAYQHKSPIVAHVSPTALALVSVGSMLCLASVYTQIGYPTGISCSAEQWFGLSGMSLILGVVVVKAYKCWRVFDNVMLSEQKKVKTSELVLFTTALLCLQFFILIVAGNLAPTKIVIASPSGGPYYKCGRAGPTQLTDAITALQLILVFGPAAVAHLLAYETKNCSPALAESTWLVYGIDSTIVCVSALVPFHLLDLGGPRLLAAQWIKVALTLYGVSFTYFALVGRIAFMLLMGRTDNLVAELRDPDALAMLGSNKYLSGSARGRGESSGHTSSHHQRIGASRTSDQHLGGVFAIKRGDQLLSTWRVHQVAVCFQLGTVSFTACYVGAVRDHQATHFSLADTSFSPRVPGIDFCIKIERRRRCKDIWLIQLPSQEEHELWTHRFVVYQEYLSAVHHRSGSLAHSKSSQNQLQQHDQRGESTSFKVSSGG